MKIANTNVRKKFLVFRCDLTFLGFFVSIWFQRVKSTTKVKDVDILTPVACTDVLKGRGEKKGTLAHVVAPKKAL